MNILDRIASCFGLAPSPSPSTPAQSSATARNSLHSYRVETAEPTGVCRNGAPKQQSRISILLTSIKSALSCCFRRARRSDPQTAPSPSPASSSQQVAQVTSVEPPQVPEQPQVTEEREPSSAAPVTDVPAPRILHGQQAHQLLLVAQDPSRSVRDRCGALWSVVRLAGDSGVAEMREQCSASIDEALKSFCRNPVGAGRSRPSSLAVATVEFWGTGHKGSENGLKDWMALIPLASAQVQKEAFKFFHGLAKDIPGGLEYHKLLADFFEPLTRDLASIIPDLDNTIQSAAASSLRYYLGGRVLNGVNLSSANLSGANLNNTLLRGANLSGANLNGANLSGADLSGTNLTDVNLTDVDLTGTDLSKVHVSLQQLFEGRCHLADVNLDDEQLSQACAAGVPICQDDSDVDRRFNHLANDQRSALRSIDELPARYNDYKVQLMEQWIDVFETARRTRALRSAAQASFPSIAQVLLNNPIYARSHGRLAAFIASPGFVETVLQQCQHEIMSAFDQDRLKADELLKPDEATLIGPEWLRTVMTLILARVNPPGTPFFRKYDFAIFQVLKMARERAQLVSEDSASLLEQVKTVRDAYLETLPEGLKSVVDGLEDSGERQFPLSGLRFQSARGLPADGRLREGLQQPGT